MIKRFIKDNCGQVLYAVIVAIMFIGLLSMTAMGLTLKNYQASLQKQQRVSDYYAADAVAELIRIGKISVDSEEKQEISEYGVTVTNQDGFYIIEAGTATIKTTIDQQKFVSWEVSYHAVQTQAGDQ